MATSAARKRIPTATSSRTLRSPRAEPIVVYMGTTIDGTSYGLDPRSQRRIREAFPGVHVSTHQIHIGHDTHEAFVESFGRFEDQVIILLTGVSASELADRFGFVSFRDPKSQREVGRLPAAKARSAR